MIELLLVVSVIVLIVSLVLVAVSMVRVKAANSRIKGSMDQLRKQAEVIYAGNGMRTYCDPSNCFCALGNCLGATGNTEVAKLSTDIDDRNGSAGGPPHLLSTSRAYCLTATLADGTNMCYDSTGKQTYGTTAGCSFMTIGCR